MSREAGGPLVQATADLLRQHAPFDAMDGRTLRWLASRLSLAYFPRDAEIAGPATGAAACLWIVKQGTVRGRPSAALPREESIDLVHGAGECFPIAALLAQRAPVYHYEAQGDTFLFELRETDFRELLERSAPFRTFCTDYLASLLEQSRHAFRAHAAAVLADEARLRSPLRAIFRREAVSCGPDTAIRDVLRAMVEAGVGSMVVVSERGTPIGIFTEADIARRVVLAGAGLDAPITSVMTPAPAVLEAAAPAHEAALTMAARGIRHVVAVEDGRLAGVVSERDLFSLQRASLHGVWDRVRNAREGGALAAAAGDLRQLVGQLLAQGIAAAQLTRMASMVSDGVVQAALRIAGEASRTRGRYCWMALGSEGRMEQALATDQDNGIIYEDEADRPALLALASEVNELLDRCGYPLCKGGIMARNPEWCGASERWRSVFAGWIDNPMPKALLNAAIFFDLRSIAGEARLVGELREWLLARASANRAFLRAMAQNAVEGADALRWWGELRLEEEGEFRGTLDLKKHALRPFVDVARIWGLAHRVPSTSTTERLQAASQGGALPAGEAASASQAFDFIQGLRLRHQYFDRPRAGAENRIDPESLSSLDRRILKDALREAAKLRHRLRLDFAL